MGHQPCPRQAVVLNGHRTPSSPSRPWAVSALVTTLIPSAYGQSADSYGGLAEVSTLFALFFSKMPAMKPFASFFRTHAVGRLVEFFPFFTFSCFCEPTFSFGFVYCLHQIVPPFAASPHALYIAGTHFLLWYSFVRVNRHLDSLPGFLSIGKICAFPFKLYRLASVPLPFLDALAPSAGSVVTHPPAAIVRSEHKIPVSRCERSFSRWLPSYFNKKCPPLQSCLRDQDAFCRFKSSLQTTFS